MNALRSATICLIRIHVEAVRLIGHLDGPTSLARQHQFSPHKDFIARFNLHIVSSKSPHERLSLMTSSDHVNGLS